MEKVITKDSVARLRHNKNTRYLVREHVFQL